MRLISPGCCAIGPASLFNSQGPLPYDVNVSSLNSSPFSTSASAEFRYESAHSPLDLGLSYSPPPLSLATLALEVEERTCTLWNLHYTAPTSFHFGRQRHGIHMATPAFTIPHRPPPLLISKTCIYKTVGKVSIPLDIYLPEDDATDKHASRHPVMVFIHGGGWTGGTRVDYSRPLFKRFLDLGFVIASVDYRLLPETDFKGQLKDIRDVEPWIRNKLAQEIKDQTIEVDVSKVLVCGASAGAHLALLTVSFSLTSYLRTPR